MQLFFASSLDAAQTLLRRSTIVITASPAASSSAATAREGLRPPPDPPSAAFASSSFTVAAAEKESTPCRGGLARSVAVGVGRVVDGWFKQTHPTPSILFAADAAKQSGRQINIINEPNISHHT